MDNEKDKIIEETPENAVTPEIEVVAPEIVAEEALPEDIASTVALDVQKTTGKRIFPSRGGKQRGGMRRGGRREDRVRPEFDQKIISMRRVTRVVAGGRRMSFSVALVAGNRKGRVGVGMGKAVDTALAIEKAFRDAKKCMINISLTKNNSIPHDVRAKYLASVVELRPAKGRGLIAGGSVRNVLELAGITNISGKLLSRSKNSLNNAKAAVKALERIHLRKKN